jgi:outer membrane receptor protein involved in Fe transport
LEYSRSLNVFLLLAGCAVRAAAQQPDTVRSRTLPAVEVRASIAPTASLDVSSTVPARVSVIDGRDIAPTKPRTLTEFLSTSGNFSVYDDLGSPWKLNLTSYGFSVGPTVGLPPGLTVFLDGVRQNEPDAQEVNFDLLPTEHIRRVEFLSGTASLLGPNSLGGAINIVTRNGAGPASVDMETSLASFGGYAGEISTQGAMPRGWDYYASGGAIAEKGWRQATGEHGYHGFMNLGRDTDRGGLRLRLSLARSRAETAGSLPESVFDRSPQMNFTPGDFEDLSSQQLSLNGRRSFWSGEFSLTAFGRHSDAERFNVNQAPDPNVRGRTRNYTAGATIDWRHRRFAGAGIIDWRVGFDGTANSVRVKIFNEAQPDGDRAGDDAPGLTTDVSSPSWDAALYTIGDYRIARWTLSAAARADAIGVPFANHLRAGDQTRQLFRNVSPRAGLSFDAGGTLTLYGSVGRSFRAPAILELGCADAEASCPLPFALGDDPPLDPVVATSYEAGARWGSSALNLAASAYRTDVRDEIFFVASEGAVLSGYFTNLPRTRREGAQVDLGGAIAGDRVAWFASYSYLRATFHSEAQLLSIRSEDDFEDSGLAGPNEVHAGDRVPLMPDHQLKVGTTYRPVAALRIGVDARIVGHQWLRGDEANETAPLGAYATTNGSISYALRGWTISGAIANLFDSHRAIFGTFNQNRRTGNLERFLTPMNARTLRLSVARSIGGAEN